MSNWISINERDRGGCVDKDVDYDTDEDDNDLLSGGADHLDRCLTLNQSLQLRRTFRRNLVLVVVNDGNVDDQIGENMLINHRCLSSAVDQRRTEWPVAKRGSGDDDCHIDCVDVDDDDDGDDSVEPPWWRMIDEGQLDLLCSLLDEGVSLIVVTQL